MRQLAPYMSSKYRVSSETSAPSATSEEAPNSEGIYSSKFVMSFVQGLDKMVREEVKTQTTAKNKSFDKKY